MNRLKNFLGNTFAALLRTFRRYPVETALAAYAFVLFVLTEEKVVEELPNAVIGILPLTLFAAMIVGDLFGKYRALKEEYARFVDANKNIVLQSVKAESDRLQKAASTAYQVYNQMDTQLQLARAKVQEAKPVFAVVEPATVPLRASSPKKIIILFVFAFLAFCAESAWILFGKEFWETFRGELKTSGRKSGN